MNGQTLTVDKLVLQINTIQDALDELKSQIVSLLPPKYGSDAWWEKTDEEGLEQIKRGEIIKFKTTNELKKHLGL